MSLRKKQTPLLNPLNTNPRQILRPKKALTKPKSALIPNNNIPNSTPTSHFTIFVSIPSYRDPECVKTLTDCFKKARFPGRLFVGICQQNKNTDLDVKKCPMYQQREGQIRILDLDFMEAKGPMYARYLIETQLYQNETFVLNIDSHMLFVPAWDELIIWEFLKCPTDKAILTTYPHDFDQRSRKLPPNIPPTYLRFRGFHHRTGFLQIEKRSFDSFPTEPQPSLFWAAGFSFSLGQLYQEVPYDPHYDYIFLGEEMTMGLRYFSHGWDFFAPSQNIVYHLVSRTYRPVFWEQIYNKKRNCVVDEKTRQARKELEVHAEERIIALMTNHGWEKMPEYQKYGIGLIRTLKEWEEYTGIKFSELWASQRAFHGLSMHNTPSEQKVKLGHVLRNVNLNTTYSWLTAPENKLISSG